MRLYFFVNFISTFRMGADNFLICCKSFVCKLILKFLLLLKKKLGLRIFTDLSKSSCSSLLLILEGCMRASGSFSKASRYCTQFPGCYRKAICSSHVTLLYNRKSVTHFSRRFREISAKL